MGRVEFVDSYRPPQPRIVHVEPDVPVDLITQALAYKDVAVVILMLLAALMVCACLIDARRRYVDENCPPPATVPIDRRTLRKKLE